MLFAHLCPAKGCTTQARIINHPPRFQVVRVIRAPCAGKSCGVAEGAARPAFLGRLGFITFAQLCVHFGMQRLCLIRWGAKHRLCDDGTFGDVALTILKRDLITGQRDHFPLTGDKCGLNKVVGHIGSITPCIHPHRPADGSGDCAQECQIAPLIRRTPRHMGIKRRRTRGDQIVLNSDMIKPPPQTDHDTTHPPIAHD